LNKTDNINGFYSSSSRTTLPEAVLRENVSCVRVAAYYSSPLVLFDSFL